VGNTKKRIEMLGIMAMLGTVKATTTIAEFLVGVAGSYFANMLPKPYIPQNFDKHAAARYKTAAKNWSKIDETRSHLYIWVDDFDSFKAFCALDHPEKEWVVNELMELWIKELHKDEVCRQLVVELKLDEVRRIIEDSLYEIRNSLRDIQAYLHRFESKGTIEFTPYTNYIPRYCERTGTDVEFLRMLGGYEYKTLVQRVLTNDGFGDEAGRYVLYSGMQTGKSTELHHLGEVLAQSGIYFPLLICVDKVKGLNYNDLPLEDEVDKKSIVLMIDALDETEENGFCGLVREIENYAAHHKKMRIIVSCRRNFCSLAKPEGFIELELLPLRWDDTLAYIRNKAERKADALIQEIIDKQLIELARIPLTLDVLISSYIKEGQLPNKRYLLYERYLMSCLNAEKEKKLKDFPMSIEQELSTMEMTAALMLMMGGREMKEDDFQKVLKIEGQEEYDHLRFDIIQRTERENIIYIGYSNNAIMDLLAAKYLTRCKTIDELKQLLYLEGTQVIRPLWYGSMTLWLEMIELGGEDFVTEVVGWLLNEQQELAVLAPDSLIDKNLKGEITIELLGKYRKENKSFYLLGNDQNPPIRQFSTAFVKFLKEEWEYATSFGKHFYNILRLTRMIDWRKLYMLDKGLAQDFEALLYQLINKPIFVLKAPGSVYMAMTNEYFYSKEQISRLYNLVNNYQDAEVIEMMAARIATLKNPDEYIDYIGKANRVLVVDYRKGHHVFLRESVYHTIAKVTTKDAIMKALSIIDSSEYWQYADDRTQAEEIYLKTKKEAEVLIDASERDNYDKIIASIEERLNVWTIKPLTKQTEEQRRKYVENAKRELELLCDLEAFRKIALRIVNYDNPQSTKTIVDLEYFYSHPQEIDDSWTTVNQYMMEYLLLYANDGSESIWRINRVQGKKALDNGDLLRKFRMQELFRFLSGERKDIKLTEEQVTLCCQTAQEELQRLITLESFNGHFTQSMRIALALFLDKKIDVDHNSENCRSLLRFICVPLTRTIDELDDENVENDMFIYLRSFVASESEFLEILTDLVTTAKKSFVDPNAYEQWVNYLFEAHHRPAVEHLTSLVINEKGNSRLYWVEPLVKEGSLIDVLKQQVEQVISDMKNGNADEMLLKAVCDALMEDQANKAWVRTQLEQYMDYCEIWGLYWCLEQLFKLGSEKALELVANNEVILRKDRHYEFTYTTASSVPLLVEVCNCCIKMDVFKPSIHSLLTSLETIAMKNREQLIMIQKMMVKRCPRIGGPDDITTRQWANQLQLKYASEHHGKMTFNEAMSVIRRDR